MKKDSCLPCSLSSTCARPTSKLMFWARTRQLVLLLAIEAVVQPARAQESSSNRVVCPSGRDVLANGRCGCGSGWFEELSSQSCRRCPPRTSSHSGAVGAHECDICDRNFFRNSPLERATSHSCMLCIPGAICEINTTLATLVLNDGYWRLSPDWLRLVRCKNTSVPACLGAASTGQCAPEFHGFSCQVCREANKYRDETSGRCVQCPNAWQRALVRLAVWLSVALALITIRHVYFSSLPQIRPLARFLNLIVASARGAGWAQKARIAVAFFQCASQNNLREVYRVSLPNSFGRLVRAFDWLEFDLFGTIVPVECLHGYEHRMLLSTIPPIVLAGLPLLAVFCVAKRVIAIAVPVALVVVFVCTASSSSAVFRAWDCIDVERLDTTDVSFLTSELTMRCFSEEHRALTRVAAVLVAVPCGSVLLFCVLSLVARKRLVERKPDAFTNAMRFLHKAYRPRVWFWPSLELAHRQVITGWVLLVPAKGVSRMIVASMTIIAYLLLSIATQPYSRREDNILAAVSQCMLVLIMIACSWIKLFEDTALDDPQLAERVLVLSPDDLFGVLLAFILLTLIATFGVAIHTSQFKKDVVPMFRLRATGSLPELTLANNHNFHAFVSHVWLTGQDAAATIKRQMQRLLPTVRIFLGMLLTWESSPCSQILAIEFNDGCTTPCVADVDDLQSIDLLEKYVQESAVMLLFLSKGCAPPKESEPRLALAPTPTTQFWAHSDSPRVGIADFVSRSCLREVGAALVQKKPCLCVWERDRSKGGAPLDTLVAELKNAAYRERLSPALQSVVVWHRITDFQVISLQQLATFMLHHSPKYSHGQEPSIFMPGSILESKLTFKHPVGLEVSHKNIGAMDAMWELRSQYGTIQAVRSEASVYQNSHAIESTHFLLYLNEKTFIEDDRHELALAVQAALERGLPVVMIHETDEARGGCEFNIFFETTPKALLDLGIYHNTLAVAFPPGDSYRRVSRALLAKQLGAEMSVSTSRVRLRMRRILCRMRRVLRVQGAQPRLERRPSSQSARSSNPSANSSEHTAIELDGVQMFDGFFERSTRMVFPFSNNLAHLAELPPPQLLTILPSGELENESKQLWLGGTWKRVDLEHLSDGELRKQAGRHNTGLDVSSAREVLVSELIGKEREPDLHERALITYPHVQTITEDDAVPHLDADSSSPFVWRREEGTIALVQCWPVRFNAKFKATYECSEANPAKEIFEPQKATDFRRAMTRLFGPHADRVPLVYARAIRANAGLVLVGTREALVDFLRRRDDVRAAMGIFEVLDEGFRTKVSVTGRKSWEKTFSLTAEGRSVVYVKSGYETMACSKPLAVFESECQLGPPVVLDSDLTVALSARKSDLTRFSLRQPQSVRMTTRITSLGKWRPEWRKSHRSTFNMSLKNSFGKSPPNSWMQSARAGTVPPDVAFASKRSKMSFRLRREKQSQGSSKHLPPKAMGPFGSQILRRSSFTCDLVPEPEPEVQMYDGFHEAIARIVFPFTNRLSHLAELPAPLLTTISPEGEGEMKPVKIWLGGKWTRPDLEAMDDKQIRKESRVHNLLLDESSAREELISELIGKEREPDLHERALVTFPNVQNLPEERATAGLLDAEPNSHFVWRRKDDTIAVVQCWPVRFNAKFKATYECSEVNNAVEVFVPQRATEFQQAMRNLFGTSADMVPLVYAHTSKLNPGVVLVGTQKGLLTFLHSRYDVRQALGIVEMLTDGFLSAVMIGGKQTTTKAFSLSEIGESVVYVKSGYESLACSKPLHVFELECSLGPPVVLRSDLDYLLSQSTFSAFAVEKT